MDATFLRGNIQLTERAVARIRKCAFVVREVVYDHVKTYENKLEAQWVKPGIEGLIAVHDFKNVPATEAEGHIALCMIELKTENYGLNPEAPGKSRSNPQALARIYEYLMGSMYWDLTWGTKRGDWARLIGEPNGVFYVDEKLFLDYKEVEAVDAILSYDSTEWTGNDDFDSPTVEEIG